MSRIRILFMGTADFAVPSLQQCFDDEHYEVVSVITQPDRPAGRKMQLQASPVKQKALERGLKVLTPERVNEQLEEIKTLRAEIAVVIAFGQILSQEFLDLFPYGAVNLHASLLPRWRGAAPIQRAIMAGDAETGVALQKIVYELDAGDVLGVRKVDLHPDEKADQLYERLKALGPNLIHIELMDYIRGNLSGKKQDESQVTIAKKIKKAEGEIQWGKPAIEIYNSFRGLYIWPGTWTQWDGKKLKILEMQICNMNGKAGEVLEIERESFVVGCGEQSLKISRVQIESRAKQSVRDFLNSQKLQLGFRFS